MIARLRFMGVAVGLLAVAREAAADDPACGKSERPWVWVQTEALSPSLGAFVSLLRAELASRGLDLCTWTEGGSAAVATVRVLSRPDGVVMTVEVHDAVTDKQVSRDVSLRGIPDDGRPLTVALAADELLRASWAELALRGAPPPARPVPEPVERTVRDSIPSPPPAASRPRTVQLGVGFVWEQYARGLVLYGADGRLGVWVVPRVEIAAQFGLRDGPSAAALDGSARPTAWSLSASGLFTLTPLESRWGLDAVASLATERLTLAPFPVDGATGSQQSGVALLAGLGASGSFAILPGLRVGVEALALLPLRGVDADDGRARFVGLSGPGWAGQLGVWSAL